MNTLNSRLLRILLSLFVLNSLFLFIYFAFHSSSPDPRSHLPANAFYLTVNHQTGQKPWPILLSYLPWSPPPRDVPLRSCEGYFGNGFTQRVDILRPQPAFRAVDSVGGSWFRCFHSETLRSSICEGGNLRMVPDLIKMSLGGERLEKVMGRGEDEELPEFQHGAFEVAEERLGFRFKRGGGRGRRRLVNEEVLNRYLPEGDIQKHTMRDLIASIRAVDSKDFACEEWVEEPTLLITRFEYANLFHTVTDWYSAYVSSRVTGLPNRPHVVFIDGHCTTQLEETWNALFSGIKYAKNFTGPVCFKHAILSPLGYETALFKGLSGEISCHGASAQELWRNPDDGRTARLSEFGEMIRSSFGFPVNKHRAEKSGLAHNVLFVRREDYLAHPRHGGKVESRLSNEQDVFESLQKWLASRYNHSECKVNLINGLFAHMSMKEQVRAIQDASVIIGAHGAGLTHIVSAAPEAVILEIISSQFRRPHFALIAEWRGLEYHAINLDGSYADPAVVIDRLGAILRGLGC